MRSFLKGSARWAGLMVAPVLFTNLAYALNIGGGCPHITDGTFGAGEWTCTTEFHQFFPKVGSAGGAFLYVDQGQGTDNNLYLMYDYTGSTTSSAFFDVFFEVVPDGHAYLVRIPGGGGLLAFERPIGSVAPLLSNGAFDIGISSGWSPLSQADLDLARFQGAVAFGSSPNEPTSHPMAEFQLTIDRKGNPAGGGQGGIYSPDPAFWSASEKSSGGADPPLTSGVFSLNSDGTTTVAALLDPNGAPLQQGSVVGPEPGTFLVFASGILGILGFRRLRGSKQ